MPQSMISLHHPPQGGPVEGAVILQAHEVVRTAVEGHKAVLGAGVLQAARTFCRGRTPS